MFLFSRKWRARLGMLSSPASEEFMAYELYLNSFRKWALFVRPEPVEGPFTVRQAHRERQLKHQFPSFVDGQLLWGFIETVTFMESIFKSASTDKGMISFLLHRLR
jgi:hypothetical protein